MRMISVAFGVCFASLVGSPISAQKTASGPAASTKEQDFESRLRYQTGTIQLDGGIATLRLPSTFRFIDHDGAKLLLEEGWGNPPGSADGVLGMIVPSAVSPLADEGWAVVVQFASDGYVDDKDASGIDYDKLLKQMQEGTREQNAERKRQGFEPVTLVGWAEKPTYDAQTHKLYWAKELAFGTETDHTLNYNVRVLGRRGVLELNAVAKMGQLAMIARDMQQVLPVVEFSDGHKYSDFLPGTDKAAAYGVAGLVAGAFAAKAGLFKGLIAILIAAKKLVVVGVIGLVAAVRKFMGRNKGEASGTSTNP
jgi:uncharacterized membrane-anchored protein